MATNQPSAGELRQRALQRNSTQEDAIQRTKRDEVPVHYALDIETPPLIACESPDAKKWTANPMDVTCRDCMTHEHFPQSVLLMREGRERLIRPFKDEAPTVTPYNVLMYAADLLSDMGENPEYDRAIVELAGNLIGAGPDDRILMARILRALKEGE